MPRLDRRSLLAAGFLLSAFPRMALAAPPASGQLRFRVFRNGRTVGEHRMSFTRSGDGVAVVTDAVMTIKLGPVPVFRYSHHAEERWRGGRIMTLNTRTDSNGKIEQVTATRTAGGVVIEGSHGRIVGPASIAPLSHWNSGVLDGPLFNPQTGKLLKVSAAAKGREEVALASGAKVAASRWSLRGETEIDDWYDESGAWVALVGKLPDKSTMEYRRL